MLFNVLVSFTFCEQCGNESHLWVQEHQKSWTGYLDVLLHIALACTMSGGRAKHGLSQPQPAPSPAWEGQIAYLQNSEAVWGWVLEGCPEAPGKVWSLNKRWEMIQENLNLPFWCQDALTIAFSSLGWEAGYNAVWLLQKWLTSLSVSLSLSLSFPSPPHSGSPGKEALGPTLSWQFARRWL